jgi:hypothetical protein
MLNNVEKEKLVIDLYYNQRNTVRQIAQEQEYHFATGRISIQTILKNPLGLDNITYLDVHCQCVELGHY